MKILTAAEMREVDRLTTTRYQVPSLTLMENAGKSVATFIQSRFPQFTQRRIVVLCGKGNNGGDGFVAARHLTQLGNKPLVLVVASPEEVTGDAATNLRHWRSTARELHVIRTGNDWVSARPLLQSAEIIVDALLGTGVRGAVEGFLGEVIRDVNAMRSPRSVVVAIDIPSGLIADTGEKQGEVVRADYTVTFTAPKPGLFLGEGAAFAGHVDVSAIGSPLDLIEEMGKGKLRWSECSEFTNFAVARKAEGHKGDYGHALIIAGSLGKSGAAVLASWAALRGGAGLVTVATPEPVLPIIAEHTPEVMTEPLVATDKGSVALCNLANGRLDSIVKGKQVLAIGPGLSTQDETQQFVRAVVGKRSLPIILDADGLNAFDGQAAELKNSSNEMLWLTPHPGEMARLVGSSTKEVQGRRVEIAIKAAADWNACVILKGQYTVIAMPDGFAYINSTGNPGMGTGGTGDVLTGLLAGMIAQYGRGLRSSQQEKLASFGVYLHGLAGDVAYADHGEAPIMASDVIRAIPRAYQQFFAECSRA